MLIANGIDLLIVNTLGTCAETTTKKASLFNVQLLRPHIPQPQSLKRYNSYDLDASN